MRARLRDLGWRLLLGFLLMMAMGSGPCPCMYADECSDPDAAWCYDGVTAATCHEPNDNGAYALSTKDCAALGLTCVVGFDESRETAFCVDLQPCAVPGEYQCSEAAEPKLLRCVPITSSDWYREESIAGITEPAGLDYVLERVGPPCVSCASSCACDLEMVCEDGLCVPGELEDGLVCCGGEQGTSCPSGASCETPQGEQSTCP